MNRVEPAHVPGCFKNNRNSPGLTGKAVKYRDKPGRRREQPCLHRDGVGAIPAQSGNIRVSTVINRAVHCLCICNKMQNKNEKSLLLPLK